MITEHVARMLISARDLHPTHDPFEDAVDPGYTRGQAELIIDAGGAGFIVKEEIMEFISRKTDVLPVYLGPGHVGQIANLPEAD